MREIADADVEQVVALWEACGLTRPWNDPRRDITDAGANPTSTVLVATDGTAKVRLMVRTTSTGVLGFYDSLGYTDSECVVLGRDLSR